VQLEKPLSLNEQRIGAALATIKGSGARRVLDLGCGEGNLLRALMKERSFEQVVGLDDGHLADAYRTETRARCDVLQTRSVAG
jgi:trans-aconitate methyltransferase